MRIRFSRALVILAAMSAFASACRLPSSSSLTSDDSIADDEIAASMGSAEAGASSSLSADLAEATGTAAKSLQPASWARASTTITVTALSQSLTVTWYAGLDGTGAVLGSGIGAVPAGALSAKIESTRSYKISGPARSGTTEVTADLIVDDPAATTGTIGISGGYTVSRSMELSSGQACDSSITHTVVYEISAVDGSIQKGGSATTQASFSINGGRTFTRSYAWTFDGQGEANLSTQRGTVITVSLQ